MFETTPLLVIVLTFIVAFMIGVLIGRLIFKSSKDNVDSEHKFHVDSATGIVSDITSLKY
jgi:uncharacterized membrane-anchored protein YhcB (DUF1043 family)